MITQNLEIPTPDGTCDAFVAYPIQKSPLPAVLFYMDAFGLRPYLHQMIKKLAAQGYYVLAPNILYRAGRTPLLNVTFPLKAEDLPAIREKILPLALSLKPEQAMADAKVYVDFLSHQPQVDPKGKVGVTGYCMGGALALRTAAEVPERIAAVASFHAGHLATDHPQSPHLGLPRIQAEIYIANADNDASMPEEQIERLRHDLQTTGRKFEIETYQGAAHGFTMMDLPASNSGALDRHWQKLTALFARTLK